MSKAELLDSTMMMIDGKPQRAFPSLRRVASQGFELTATDQRLYNADNVQSYVKANQDAAFICFDLEGADWATSTRDYPATATAALGRITALLSWARQAGGTVPLCMFGDFPTPVRSQLDDSAALLASLRSQTALWQGVDAVACDCYAKYPLTMAPATWKTVVLQKRLTCLMTDKPTIAFVQAEVETAASPYGSGRWARLDVDDLIDRIEYARSMFDYVCFWGWQSAAKEAPKVGWRSDDPWVIELTKYIAGTA